MKKYIALVWILIFVLLAGCSIGSTRNDALKAWTGEFSETQLEKAIREYQSNYSSIAFSETDEALSVTFATDFEAAACKVVRVAPTDDADIQLELDGYIDRFVEASCGNGTVTVDVDWWRTADGWVRDYPVWSYLACVEDADGATHYYYFRVDYSAFPAP